MEQWIIEESLYETFCGLFHPDRWEEHKTEFWRLAREKSQTPPTAPDAALLAAAKTILETCNVRIDDPRIVYFDGLRAAIAQAETAVGD